MKAMSPAERQAAFRKRHRPTKSRINLLVTDATKWKLYSLAYRHKLTMTQMLEKIIEGAE